MALLEADFVASVASRALHACQPDWVPLERVSPASGWIVLAEVLTENSRYGSLELGNGSVVRLRTGARIVGAIGARKASRAYGGRVPETLSAGDILSLLNLGGVIGELESGFDDLGAPVSLRILAIACENGVPRTLKENAIPPRDALAAPLPMIAVCGTAMNVGKTTAVVQLTRALSAQGYAVFAVKAAGVACLKDAHAFAAAGARDALGFWDSGFPSSVGLDNIADIIKGLFSEMLEKQGFPENSVGIVELGDGLLGHYGGIQFFLDPELREHLKACVLCANDWVGVYGAREILKVFGVRRFFVTGIVAESAVGSPLLRFPFCNILKNPEPLSEWVLQRLRPESLPVREASKWRLSTASAS
jgi:hypothetical protein